LQVAEVQIEAVEVSAIVNHGPERRTKQRVCLYGFTDGRVPFVQTFSAGADADDRKGSATESFRLSRLIFPSPPLRSRGDPVGNVRVQCRFFSDFRLRPPAPTISRSRQVRTPPRITFHIDCSFFFLSRKDTRIPSCFRGHAGGHPCQPAHPERFLYPVGHAAAKRKDARCRTLWRDPRYQAAKLHSARIRA
jgi:hypothetical protein